MRKLLLFLLAVFVLSFNATTAKGKAKTLKVEDSSVGVWSIWTENTEELSSRYAGFVKYKDKDDDFMLVKTKKYFANHIMMKNLDELESQLNRGCQRGFFRCLLLGTELKLPAIDRRDSQGTSSENTVADEESAQFQAHNLTDEDSQASAGQPPYDDESVLNSERHTYHNLTEIRELIEEDVSSDDDGKDGKASNDTPNSHPDTADIQSGLENSVFLKNEDALKTERGNIPLRHLKTEGGRRDKPGPGRDNQNRERTDSNRLVADETRKETVMDRFLAALSGNFTLQIVLGFGALFFLVCFWDDYGRDWFMRYVLGKKKVRKLRRYMRRN